jgi:hypothetical protein
MYAKYTEVQYDDASYEATLVEPYPTYVTECLAKAQEMYDLGKTPSVYASQGSIPHSYRREWVDLAAAEEWELFQQAKAAEHGFIITYYGIGDITP